MQTPSLAGLEGLSEIGLGGGVDMRPTLLRVLTDLYVQKLTHTADEDRHYTELALRLLESVDVPTRVAVAARLAHHLSPPRQVVQKLATDLPEVAVALRGDLKSQTRVTAPSVVQPNFPVARIANRPAERVRNATAPAPAPARISVEIAGELNELFFAAAADERRLILLNLDIVAGGGGQSSIVADVTVGRRLEAAALAHKREEFARELAHGLRISREQAHRIAGDALGEPIVVAGKAMGIARELLYRILLFVNTAVGHSVERVHALAMLYDEMSAQAAQDMVAIWQALGVGKGERRTPAHRPLLAGDRPSMSVAPATRRAPASPQRIERRDAS
jgi:hypothetical protein